MANDLYETLKQTATGFLKAYEGTEPWNPDKIWQYRTEDSLHALHPNENLPDNLKQPMNKEGFYDAMHFFGPVMESTRYDVEDIAVDVENRKVAVRMQGVFDLKATAGASAEKGWTTEYIMLMKMEESGKKIKRVDEFMDSERLMREVATRAQAIAQSEAGKS